LVSHREKKRRETNDFFVLLWFPVGIKKRRETKHLH
jgi:hypothetical protein